MNLKNALKSFVYLVLITIFYIFILMILSFKFSFWIGILMMILFLFLWKLIYGLAYLNYFILLFIFINSYILNMAFKLPAVLLFVLTLLFLFYIRAIYQKELIKSDQKTFLAIKYLFFFIIFFANILSLYTLFYILHWSFTLIFIITIGVLFFCLQWYQKLDDIKMSFFENLIFIVVLSQITWFLFNLSGGFFIFPILIIFWFYNLINFYKNIEKINVEKIINWIIMPLILTLIFSFYIKI